MNTSKKTLLAILATTSLLFTTASFADSDRCDRGDRGGKHGYEKKCGNGEYKKYKNCKSGKNFHKGDKSRFIIGAVYSLENITKDQETKIDKYVKDFQKSRMDALDAFSKDGFDKEAYVKARMAKKENMIEAKASLIENIYSVLTKDQKAELKEKLDKFKEKRRYKG